MLTLNLSALCSRGQVKTPAPRSTKSMRVALEDLRLEHLWVIYPGETPYALDERLSVEPVHRLGNVLNADWPEA